jgi:sulfite exporter TauE/SafE
VETYWLAITLGIGSSFTHCAGMCGPIQFTIQRSESKTATFYYHMGRITGYTLLGLILGGLFKAQEIALPASAKQYSATLLGLLYIVFAIAFIKKDSKLEKHLSFLFPNKLFAKYLNSPNGYSFFPAGLMASLLPCPTTIAALGYALYLQHPYSSAMSMLLFGTATLPFFILLSSKSVKHFFNYSKVAPKLFGLLFLFLAFQKIHGAWFSQVPTCH